MLNCNCRCIWIAVLTLGLGMGAATPGNGEVAIRSHPPMRPLPMASSRKLGKGPCYFVDGKRGDDKGAGTEEAPWRTLAHGLTRLQAGDTLCLRGGTYYETVVVKVQGTAKEPITIRSYPGELAVVDGGYREFFEEPATAWELVPDGADGEYRSTKTYPELAAEPDPRFPVFGSGAHSSEVKVLGNFGDSMVPLHGYFFARDLRSKNEYWNLPKLGGEIYCGPGLWFDAETSRVHTRLAPTTLAAIGDGNYRGESDPRRLPLVVGGVEPVINIEGAEHLRIYDLVARGTRSRTMNITGAVDLVLDGVHAYGGAPAMYLSSSRGVRIVNSTLHGISAPWSSRGSEKYRGISTYLFVAGGRNVLNDDVEMAYSEFTDCQDGLVVGTIDNLRFHHNLVDNFSDDGLYMTLWGKPGRNIRIYQNIISRCLSCFSFAGKGAGQEGTDFYVYRNIIDLRGPVHYGMPRSPEQTEITSRGRTCGDHGGPIWKPMMIYQNTVITARRAWRSYYGCGLSSHMLGTKRRLFNNIFVVLEGLPGLNLGRGTEDIEADGNLHWSIADGPGFEGDFFAPPGLPKYFKVRQESHPPGWAQHDLFADPAFVEFSSIWPERLDLSLRQTSPARDVGVVIPANWPDPLRDPKKAKPDLGAIPFGTASWGVGVHGRVPFTGKPQ